MKILSISLAAFYYLSVSHIGDSMEIGEVDERTHSVVCQ